MKLSPILLWTLFCVGGFWVSYGSLSTLSSLWVILLFVVVPWCAAAIESSKTEVIIEPLRWKLTSPWVLATGVVCFLGLRFATQFSIVGLWNTDQGLFAQAALDYKDGGAWKFFHTSTQHPFPYFGLLAFGFRIFHDPRVFNWIPAVISFLPGLFFYWFLRGYWGKGPAALGASLLWVDGALSVFSRSGAPVILLPAWETVVLALAWCILVKSGKPLRRRDLALLGFAVGLLAYTYVAGWAMIFGLSCMAAFIVYRQRNRQRLLGSYLGTLGLVLAPWLWAAWHEGFGQHIQGVSFFHSQVSWWTPILNLFLYWAAFFWGTAGSCEYMMPRGGFLNPLLGALVLLGLLECLKNTMKTGWVFFLALVALLPGLFSVSVEPSRVAMIIPFLAAAMVLGFERLVRGFPRGLVLGCALFCVASTAVWDAALMSGWNPRSFFQKGSGNASCDASGDYRLSYSRIEKQFLEKGRGMIWPELAPQVPDPRLYPATLPLNGTDRSEEGARWYALWLNKDVRPFLDSQWHGGEWCDLSPERFPAFGMEALVILPSPPSSIDANWWLRLQKVFHRAMAMEDAVPEGGSVKECIRFLEGHRADAQGDRFLEMVYWERLALLYRRELRYQDDMDALQKAVTLGYPAAHLFYQIGSNYLRAKEYDQAEAYFRKAMDAPLNSTAASVWLERLGMIRSHPEMVEDARKP